MLTIRNSNYSCEAILFILWKWIKNVSFAVFVVVRVEPIVAYFPSYSYLTSQMNQPLFSSITVKNMEGKFIHSEQNIFCNQNNKRCWGNYKPQVDALIPAVTALYYHDCVKHLYFYLAFHHSAVEKYIIFNLFLIVETQPKVYGNCNVPAETLDPQPPRSQLHDDRMYTLVFQLWRCERENPS
jgi:hypothetical protein